VDRGKRAGLDDDQVMGTVALTRDDLAGSHLAGRKLAGEGQWNEFATL
jgi:hypothetical protein